MNIERDSAGVVKYENTSGSVMWFVNSENVIVKNDELNVILIINGKVYTLPVEGLEVNGTPFVGTPLQAAESVATEVFNTTP